MPAPLPPSAQVGGAPSMPHGRDIAETHARFCVHAGVKVTKFRATSVPGVWCFQIGPSEALPAADHLWAARYILSRVCEAFGVGVSWDPKPVPGDWPGCGCSVKFSTVETRVPGNGWFEIERQLSRLQQMEKHVMHMQAYGLGLDRRTGPLAGLFQPAWDVGEGSSSTLYVPSRVLLQRCGHWVDQRPGASLDPYIALLLLISTALDIPLPERSGADLEGSHHQETILSSMLHRFGAINTSGGGSMHGGSHYGATGGLGATNRGGGVYGGLGALGGSAHDGVGWLMMRAQGAPGAKAAPEQSQVGAGNNSAHRGRSGVVARRSSQGRNAGGHDAGARSPLVGSVPEGGLRAVGGEGHMRFGDAEDLAEGSSHKRPRSSRDHAGRPRQGGQMKHDCVDTALLHWEPPWMEGTGEVARAREPAGHKKEVQKRIASGEEMSETSPDSIAAMMARDAAEGNSEEGSESGERSGATGSGVRGAGRAAESGAGPGGRSGEGEPEPARSHAPS